MNEFVRTLAGILTLGLSELVKAIKENTKCPYDYIYKQKGKQKCCKWRNKCALSFQCMEDIESCRRVHKVYDQAKKDNAVPNENNQ